MEIFLAFLKTLLLSFIELFYLVGALIIIGFLLGFLEKCSNTFLVRAFGPKGVLLTAWIGTPIHELGHLIQCFIWGHRVTKVKLLQLNTNDGILGYVNHQYNLNSVYQQVGNFFIGLGPIFSGIGSLILGMYFFVPHSYAVFISDIQHHISFESLNLDVIKTIGSAMAAVAGSFFTLNNIINPLFWLFLIVAISISSHIGLSKEDIENSKNGLLMIFFLLVLFNIASRLFGINSYQLVVKLSEYNTYLLAFSSIALLFSLFTLAISFLLYQLKRSV